MTHESLLNRDWDRVVQWLGGAAALEQSARETGAFLQAREVRSAVDLLRLILAYCLGRRGFRLTTAWAASMGLVDISAPALLYRLRQSGDWLTFLIDHVLRSAAPEASRGQSENAASDATDSTEPQMLSHPCPCCGGRMIVIEIFERGCSPRTRPVSVIRIDTS